MADVLQTLTRVIVVGAVGMLLIHGIGGAGLGRTELLLLCAVMIVSAALGLIPGFLAAAFGLIVYHLLLGAAMPPLDLRARNTFLLALFGVCVGAVGVYTDTVRQRHKQARSLLELAQPLSARASDRAVGRFFELAKHKGSTVSRTPAIVDVRQAAISLLIAALGLTVAFLLRDVVGPLGGALAAMTAVVFVARLTGGRFGLAAGVMVGAALCFLARGDAAAGLAPPLEQAFDITLFAALGWSVGSLSDRLRHERAALKTLIDASRDLSADADETASRQVLVDSLRRISRGGQVQLIDETGAAFIEPAAAGHAPAPDERAIETAGWRTHRLAADGREVGVVRWRFPGPDRDTRVADQIAASVADLGASAIVRTRLNAERAEMEYVARAEHLRTVLLDAVSHHFRSPLAGILGSVTGILSRLDRNDDRISRELLLIIKEQANRLGRYVDNFLSLSRLESGSVEINLGDVSLEGLIYDVWETFDEAGSARRYLEVDIDPDVIRSDASLLNQVFGNILANAIKFSPEESMVTVSGRRQGDWLVIEVADQGTGVPAQSLERMFERFYRSPGASAPGLGLGLYITRSLVKMLGGEATAHNRSDGGSGLVVSIQLPVVDTYNE